jgi:seryl-tRNA synthetase
MEVAYPSREPFFVEECERPRLVSPGDPAELEKERDKLRRELDNLDRNSDCVQRDLMAKLRYTEDHRNVLSDRVAFLQRELERLKPKKRGL